MPRQIDRSITNQVRPIDTAQSAAPASGLVVALAAHAALQAATAALDWVEATACASVADPAADQEYRAVVGRRLAARAALSTALRGLRASAALVS